MVVLYKNFAMFRLTYADPNPNEICGNVAVQVNCHPFVASYFPPEIFE